MSQSREPQCASVDVRGGASARHPAEKMGSQQGAPLLFEHAQSRRDKAGLASSFHSQVLAHERTAAGVRQKQQVPEKKEHEKKPEAGQLSNTEEQSNSPRDAIAIPKRAVHFADEDVIEHASTCKCKSCSCLRQGAAPAPPLSSGSVGALTASPDSVDLLQGLARSGTETRSGAPDGSYPSQQASATETVASPVSVSQVPVLPKPVEQEDGKRLARPAPANRDLEPMHAGKMQLVTKTKEEALTRKKQERDDEEAVLAAIEANPDQAQQCILRLIRDLEREVTIEGLAHGLTWEECEGRFVANLVESNVLASGADDDFSSMAAFLRSREKRLAAHDAAEKNAERERQYAKLKEIAEKKLQQARLLKMVLLGDRDGLVKLLNQEGARMHKGKTAIETDEQPFNTVLNAIITRAPLAGFNSQLFLAVVQCARHMQITELDSQLLFAAVRASREHPKDMVALFRMGFSVESRDEEGNTALHWAARLGLLASVQTLLFWGADPNARNLAGNTPLHLVAKARYLLGAIGAVLVNAGASADAANNSGETPLFWAAKHAANDEGTGWVQWLLVMGADSKKKSTKGTNIRSAGIMYSSPQLLNWTLANVKCFKDLRPTARDSASSGSPSSSSSPLSSSSTLATGAARLPLLEMS